MRRILTAVCMTATALVLLFGYRTSHPGSVHRSAPGSAGTTGTPGATAPGGKAYDGPVVQTRWGPVQVRIEVTSGKVTAATALQLPSGNQRDVQINNVAVPRLNAEVLQAQSSQIDTVSGATVTSDGYVTSLQSALNAAGL